MFELSVCRGTDELLPTPENAEEDGKVIVHEVNSLHMPNIKHRIFKLVALSTRRYSYKYICFNPVSRVIDRIKRDASRDRAEKLYIISSEIICTKHWRTA